MRLDTGFEAALEALKEGRRIAREGWNGHNMWLSLTPGRTVHAGQLWSNNNAAFAAVQPMQQIEVLSYVTLKTADGAIVPWTPSQTDLLAEDWEILPQFTEI